MGKFLKGLLYGGIVGAGFAWLNGTKQGKAIKVRLADEAHTLAKKAIAMVPENDMVSPKVLEEKLEAIVKSYAESKNMAGAYRSFLTSEAKKYIKKMRKK